MKKHITVVGSFVVDLMARAPHLPVEGETVKSNMFKIGPGGKGFNQGVAAKKAGADITMVTKLGKDDFANIALDTLKELNMTTEYIFQTSKTHTGTALIMVDENTSENKIMVTSGACGNITKDDLQKIRHLIKNSAYLLTQLETNLDSIEYVIDIAHEYNVPVVLNPAPVQTVSDDMLEKVSIITPNEVEASILTGIEVKTVEDASKAAKVFYDKGVEQVVITLGSKGVYVYTKDKEKLIPSYKVNAIDTTGAGDAFNGGLVAALAEGKDIWEASRFANALEAIAVTRLGTTPAMPTREEVDTFIQEQK